MSRLNFDIFCYPSLYLLTIIDATLANSVTERHIFQTLFTLKNPLYLNSAVIAWLFQSTSAQNSEPNC